jgi:ABC-type oligopeptide transport system ATPase subunit
VETSLKSVGLNPVDVLNKFTHQLSGGQLQRILIARALLLDIKILVADEIISMIDASTRVDVLNLLSNLKARGLGVLFITHDLSLGNYISERTIILRRGVMVEMGATQKVFDNPQHEYTRMLLTAVPQLHKKWEAGLEPELAAMGVTSADEKRPGRYSRSSLHPLANMHARKGRRDAAEHELSEGLLRTDTYLRTHEEVPPLVEIEDDHFVVSSAAVH